MRNLHIGSLLSLMVALLLPRAPVTAQDITLDDHLGSPLNPEEYERFFSLLTPTWKAETICRHRFNYGCLNPSLLQLDKLESHGLVPEGVVCSNIPYAPRFESFCQFAQFRCTNKIYYAQRVLCTAQRASSGQTNGEATSVLEQAANTVTTGASTQFSASTITDGQTFQPRAELLYKNVGKLIQSFLSLGDGELRQEHKQEEGQELAEEEQEKQEEQLHETIAPQMSKLTESSNHGSQTQNLEMSQ